LAARLKSREQNPWDGHKQVEHGRKTLACSSEKSTFLVGYGVFATHKSLLKQPKPLKKNGNGRTVPGLTSASAQRAPVRESVAALSVSPA
jgi:hypothetical protein